MKGFLFLIIVMMVFVSCKQKQTPVTIIFDTDIAPDYDDVGALAVLHALADKGEAKILATISCNAFKTTVPTLSVINTYFNRPDIPIGVIKSTTPSYPCERLYAEAIISKYPHSVRSNEKAMDAVKLYRKVLSSQPDTTVDTIDITANGKWKDLQFVYTIKESAWIALRIYPSVHTNPVFVIVDQKPIRSKKSAEWCLKAVDQCWKMKKENIRPGERSAAEAAYNKAREIYNKIIQESPDK